MVECRSLNVPSRAKLCAISIYSDDFAGTLQQSLLNDFGLSQARGITALLQESVDIPSIGLWINELATCSALERLMRKRLELLIYGAHIRNFLKTDNLE